MPKDDYETDAEFMLAEAISNRPVTQRMAATVEDLIKWSRFIES